MPAARHCASKTGPAAAGFWRFALALPLLAILASREPGGVATPPKWALLAGLFFALDLSFWHYGIVMTSVANATVLCNLTPVVVAARLLTVTIATRLVPAAVWVRVSSFW